MLHFFNAENNFLNIIFRRLLELDMDVGRKFILQWLNNVAMFSYLPLTEQSKTELINLFLKVHNTERRNHQFFVFIFLCPLTFLKHSSNQVTQSTTFTRNMFGDYLKSQAKSSVVTANHAQALCIHSEIWAGILKFLTHSNATTKCLTSLIP